MNDQARKVEKIEAHAEFVLENIHQGTNDEAVSSKFYIQDEEVVYIRTVLPITFSEFAKEAGVDMTKHDMAIIEGPRN